MRHILRKYFIMGSQDCVREPGEILKEAIAAGITAFQFREKGNGSLQGKAKVALGQQLREMCQEQQIPFIINDDVGLANVLDVDGIHVGQDDTDVQVLREKFPSIFIGLSVSNEFELKNSPLSFVDYVGAGPIFKTNSKADAKKPVGTAWIHFLRNKHPELPIVGIGGINETNAYQVLEAGADGVAIISAITKSDNIARTVEQL